MEKEDGKMDITGMLLQSFGEIGLGVMKSRVKRPMACIDCFGKMKLGKVNVTGYYYRTHFSQNFYRRQKYHRVLGEGGLFAS